MLTNYIMKNKSLTIKKKTFKSLTDLIDSDNCVLVLTLASLILGLLLISVLTCQALFQSTS